MNKEIKRLNKGFFLAIFLSFIPYTLISLFIEDPVIPNLFFKDLPATMPLKPSIKG